MVIIITPNLIDSSVLNLQYIIVEKLNRSFLFFR
jgi:hypothetical protein